MQWTTEAEEYFERVPGFIRNTVRKGIEARARKDNKDIIDLNYLKQARDAMMGVRHKDQLTPPPASGQNKGMLDRHSSQLSPEYERSFFSREGVDPLTHAFPKKSTVHAGMGGEPVEKSGIAPIWNRLMQNSRRESTAAYFHIPFCRGHCLYCGFYVNPAGTMSSMTYSDALIKELIMDQDKPAVSRYPIHAVYLGGGTPTVLEPGDLTRLLREIRRRLPITNDCEITVESTIADLDEETLTACLAGGANRFSIGVQSFDTAVRKSLGRRSDRDTVIKTLTQARDTNAAVIVIDLIYGLPGQNMTVWENDIQTLIDLNIDGADLYQLNIFHGSLLDIATEKGRLPCPADIPEQARMFKRGIELMDQSHFRRLSMSHWCRGTRERNIYNLLIKKGAPCLPFGSCAGGSLGGYGCYMESDFSRYIHNLSSGIKPLSGMLAYPHHKPLINCITGELEEGHLNLSNLDNRFHTGITELFRPLLDQWERAGLVKLRDGWMSLTLAGQFWQVNLAQALIDYYDMVEKPQGDSTNIFEKS
ncbi:MAG: heme anaerobic degradation radical SAM methyltransferase ChuW/HutW [Pseudomonadota bacterium]